MEQQGEGPHPGCRRILKLSLVNPIEVCPLIGLDRGLLVVAGGVGPWGWMFCFDKPWFF